MFMVLFYMLAVLDVDICVVIDPSNFNISFIYTDNKVQVSIIHDVVEKPKLMSQVT